MLYGLCCTLTRSRTTLGSCKPSSPCPPRLGRSNNSPAQRSCPARAGNYNGRPFTRSGITQEDLLEDFFTGLVDAAFPASDRKSNLDMRLAVDMFEDYEAYHLYADLPGVKKDQLRIQVKDGLLIISGKRDAGAFSNAQNAPQACKRQERQAGTFYRQLDFPTDADAGNIRAKVSEGILELTIYKDILTRASDDGAVDVDF